MNSGYGIWIVNMAAWCRSNDGDVDCVMVMRTEAEAKEEAVRQSQMHDLGPCVARRFDWDAERNDVGASLHEANMRIVELQRLIDSYARVNRREQDPSMGWREMTTLERRAIVLLCEVDGLNARCKKRAQVLVSLMLQNGGRGSITDSQAKWLLWRTVQECASKIEDMEVVERAEQERAA